MRISYSFNDDIDQRSTRDDFPSHLDSVPRVGDKVAGQIYGICLEVESVTFYSNHVSIVLCLPNPRNDVS